MLHFPLPEIQLVRNGYVLSPSPKGICNTWLEYGDMVYCKSGIPAFVRIQILVSQCLLQRRTIVPHRTGEGSVEGGVVSYGINLLTRFNGGIAFSGGRVCEARSL